MFHLKCNQHTNLRPREELIFAALAAMHISKHDRLVSTSFEAFRKHHIVEFSDPIKFPEKMKPSGIILPLSALPVPGTPEEN